MATQPPDPHATSWQPAQQAPQPTSDPDLTCMEDAGAIRAAAERTRLEPAFVPPPSDPAITRVGQAVAPPSGPAHPDMTTWEDAASVAAAAGLGRTRVHGPETSHPTVQLDAAVASGLAGQAPTHVMPPNSQVAAALSDGLATGPSWQQGSGTLAPDGAGITRAAPPRDAAPERVGRYRIERALASGGMGTVYVAHDPQLDRKVALKVMRPLGADYNRRFQVEARATARLDHPHIVSVYDAGEVQGRPYLVMALVDGESLDDRLTRVGTFAPAEVARIGIALAEALGYAHTQHVLHRDLKPENVLITAQNTPLITDFGLAKLERGGPTDLTVPGTVLGTPAFMSPEQAQGLTDQIDGRTDVYSLGATLFALLTNQPPIDGPSATAVIQAVPRTAVPNPCTLRDDVPPALADVIMRCLAKSPDGRYPDMAAVKVALQQAQRAAAPAGAAAVAAPPRRPSKASGRGQAPRRRKASDRARAQAAGVPSQVPDNTGKTVLLAALAVSLFAITFVGVLIAGSGEDSPPATPSPVVATPAPSQPAQPAPDRTEAPADPVGAYPDEQPARPLPGEEPPPHPPGHQPPPPHPTGDRQPPPHPPHQPPAGGDDWGEDDWGSDDEAWGPADGQQPPQQPGWRPPPPGDGQRPPPPGDGQHPPPHPPGHRPPPR